MLSKICRKCNNEIDSTYINECKKCYKKAYYAKTKEKQLAENKLRYVPVEKPLQKNCNQCDVEFTPKMNYGKFCSPKCGVAFWRKNNKDKIKQDQYDRYHTDLRRRLSTCLRSRVNKALNGAYKPDSVTKTLGCIPEFLISHLESLWKPGMTWENYGKGHDKWNVDHIVPLISFDLSSVEQFEKANHYTNLQPLWELDNLSKGGK